MKRVLSLILSACLALSTLCLFGCQSEEANDNENLPTRTVIELTEANLWKYIDVSISGVAKVGSDDNMQHKRSTRLRSIRGRRDHLRACLLYPRSDGG